MSLLGSAITGAIGAVARNTAAEFAKAGAEAVTKDKNVLMTAKEPIPKVLTDSELKKKVCGKKKDIGISKKKLIKELNELKREKYNKRNKRKSNLGRILDRIE